MTTEQISAHEPKRQTIVDYAEDLWYNELVRMQNTNTWTDQPIYLSGLFQELYADSIVNSLRQKPYFQKFGGKTLEVIALPSSEPYMKNIAIKVCE